MSCKPQLFVDKIQLTSYFEATPSMVKMLSYKQYNDESLLTLFQSGDRAAFDEIYERYWDRLFAVAARRLENLDEAKDVVQEVMFKLWQRRGVLALQGYLSAYLAAAVKYEVINKIVRRRKEGRYKSTSLLANTDNSTQEYLDFSALEQRLTVLVKALPEKCRMAFTLSREQGMSQKEIARHMQISENTVESHLKKALKYLRTNLHLLFTSAF
jgi:RNA polymerase sigma-70 factor (family 1)